jgi:hypothetical protein
MTEKRIAIIRRRWAVILAALALLPCVAEAQAQRSPRCDEALVEAVMRASHATLGGTIRDSACSPIDGMLGPVMTRAEDILRGENPSDPYAQRPERGAALKAALRQS